MFFDEVGEIAKIAERNGTSVFVVPREMEVEIPGAVVVQPEEKTVITIDQVRKVMALTEKRQLTDLYVLVRPAEQMRDQAANALLKTLEQPGERVHFVLVTERLDQILPTIRSRAAVYYLRPGAEFLRQVAGDEKQKALARRLLTTTGADLVTLAGDITKKRDGVQRYALEVLAPVFTVPYSISGMIFLIGRTHTTAKSRGY